MRARIYSILLAAVVCLLPPALLAGDAGSAGVSEMSTGDAMILGLVEGLTEYLPVSSTGHLILTERILGIPEGAVSNAYAIFIQLGAIAAVLGLYRKRVAQMLRGLMGRDAEGRRLAALIVAAFLPAAVAGLLLHGWIEARLYGLWAICAAWAVGGVAILVTVRICRTRQRPQGLDLAQLSWRGALLIGCAQSLALWPGVSRSLVTIVGGILVGLSLSAAVEFSFLLGVITLGAATVYAVLKEGAGMLSTYGAPNLLLGFATATVSAVWAVKWMIHYLNRHGLALFGWYRVGLATVVAVLLLVGVL